MTEYINPASKLLLHIDHVSDIKNGNKRAPVNVEVDVSNRCNAGCKFCHFSYLHTGGLHAEHKTKEAGDLMSIDEAAHVIKELESNSVQSITWSGGGEPLTNIDFPNMALMTHIDQGIYTNGIGINPNTAAILKRKMKWVYISLDAPDRKIYNKVKGVDKFDLVIENIKNLKKMTGDAIIGVGFLLTENTYPLIHVMHSLGNEIGADYIQYRPAVLFDEDNPNKKVFDYSWITPALDMLEDAKASQSSVNLVYDHERFIELRDWKEHPYKKCHWVKMQSVVTPDLKVWPCCNLRGIGEPIGDLSHESWGIMWDRWFNKTKAVDENCRILCRGHMPNLLLKHMVDGDNPHRSFI